MEGRMQSWSLTISRALEYAARWHPEQEVVCKTVEGPTVISTYADLSRRSQLCALALKNLGVSVGTVVGTLAWNTTRHLEAWYGIMGLGAICHTLNPRLSPADLTYIINHAGDSWVMVDAPLLPLLLPLLKDCPGVQGVIVLTDRVHMPKADSSSSIRVPVPLLCYDEVLDSEVAGLPFRWPDLHEDTPCGLCYTSGTTGNPKGVMYSHRSNFLHSLIGLQPDALAMSSSSTMLMIVPMFHANSWGLSFAGPMVGAKLVLPGPHLDGGSVFQLLEVHRVNLTAGVPTVWMSLLGYMAAHGHTGFNTLKRLVIGGAAAPKSMIRAFESMGVEVRHMWGMTELSPLGSLGVVKGSQIDGEISREEEMEQKVAQGRPHLFCDMRIVDDEGRELPHDGAAVGNLEVRGPIVVGQYHRSETPTVGSDLWFHTGDVASIDPLGYMRITDRSKDVIKSGGEWISSITLENLAMGHPQVVEAAVIAMQDDKWGERPLLVVATKPPAAGDEELRNDILRFMAGHSSLAKYALPDDVVFVAEIPHTATGKVSKLLLRQMFKDYKPGRSKL